MGRTVTDRGNIARRFAVSVRFPLFGRSLPSDYTQFLERGALNGARIGRDVRYFDYSYFGSGIPGDEETVAFAENALECDAQSRRDDCRY